MKTASFVGLVATIILAGGCATQPNRYSTYSTTTGDQVVSMPRSVPYDTGAAPPSQPNVTPATSAPRYEIYVPTQGSGAVAQLMTENDRALAEQVRGRAEPYARGANVSVYGRNGTITLSGTVPTEGDRIAIVNAARQTPGVVAVSDQLVIAPASVAVLPSVSPPVTTVPTGRYDADRVYAPSPTDYFSLHVRGLSDTDRMLGQRILEGLRTDSVLPTIMPIVNIDVSDARVTVRGTVQSQEQKRMILANVQRAAGVNNVYDELQVVPLR